MAMINIPLPENLARIYLSVSDEDRRKAQWLIELALSDLFLADSDTLRDVVREIGQRAEERGMTQEILQTLLSDDE
jgi:hypothetical protein